MSDINSLPKDRAEMAVQVPPRSETQRKLDLRSAVATEIGPSDRYSLGDRIEAKVDALGDSPFLVYGDEEFSYRQCDQLINQYANTLLARGIGPGDVCAIAMENRPEMFFAWFAVAKIGAIATFVNYHLLGKPLVHVLESTGASTVLVGEECLDPFLATPEVLDRSLWLVADPENPANPNKLAAFDTDFAVAVSKAPRSRPDPALRSHVFAEDDMLYIFTSGTTGLPKAAKYSHMRWMTSGDVMEVTIDASSADVFYCCLPLYHGAAATSVTSTALAAGASIVIRRKFSASQFWDDVRHYGVTVFQYIGEICRYLLNKPERPDDRDHTLRCMLGAGLTADSWQRWIDRFGPMNVFEGWGATEANTATINLDNRVGSCGRIPDWGKTNLRLLRYNRETQAHDRDENGYCIHCQPGEVGEAVGYIVDSPDIGAGRFEGYTSSTATESKILRDVFQDGDAWWSSGDLLRYDEDGYCYFVDRIGDTFRWKSENVSTQEVASELSDFQGLELVNVYGVKVPDHEGRAGMASLVMQPGHPFDPKAFFELVSERLPHYARPVFVRVAKQADMTSTFKHRKVDLQREGYDPQRFEDPLFIKDDSNHTYAPFSLEALQRNGLPPFEGE